MNEEERNRILQYIHKSDIENLAAKLRRAKETSMCPNFWNDEINYKEAEQYLIERYKLENNKEEK